MKNKKTQGQAMNKMSNKAGEMGAMDAMNAMDNMKYELGQEMGMNRKATAQRKNRK